VKTMTIDFQDCLASYSKHGVQFSYPDIWEIDERMEGTDVIVHGCPPPPQAVDSCVEAFQEEYEDLEVTTTECKVAEMPAYSRNLQFICLELTNTVGLCSVRTTDFTLLIWWQGTDHELEEAQPMIDHMTRSVRAVSLID
jgi:hypothetical protein